MFYSETLLSKTGPLAQVWLSANLERRLTKSNIIQAKVGESVSAIVAQNQAPLALRLTGQLLLGVVRIYSRKTRYLLDDCNEALMKIKMAFRPGNVDLPMPSHPAHSNDLILPDKITPHDLLLNPAALNFDDDFLPAPGTNRTSRRAADITLDMDNDYLVHDLQLEIGRGTQLVRNEEIDTEEAFQLQDAGILDIGDDMDFFGDETTGMEMGRDAPAAPNVADDLFSRDGDGDLTMKMGADETDISRGLNFDDDDDDDDDEPEHFQQDLGNNFRVDDDTVNFFPGRADSVPPISAPTPGPRESSTMSEAPSDLANEVRNLNVSDYLANETVVEEDVPAQPKRQIKKRKIAADAAIELSNKELKAMQQDHTRILKEPSFLPRDATLLSLLTLQRSNGFASNVFYPKNIHPDLAKLLSPDFVKEMASRKRKRLLDEEAPDANNQDDEPVHLDTHEDTVEHIDEDGNVTIRPATAVNGEEEQFHIPADDGEFDYNPADDGPSFAPQTPGPGYHQDSPEPEDDGPAPEIVSQATTHAVHLLRDRFTEPSTQSTATKESIKFTDIFPPRQTTRQDATKMFFEILVLATKDAVAVAQNIKGGNGGIEVRGKKKLWGSYAAQDAQEKEGEMGGRFVGASQAVETSA